MNAPPKLAAGLSRFIRESADSKIMVPVGVSLYVLFLFAMFHYRFSTIWTFLLAPIIGPLASAAFFTVRPLNPYRNIYSQLEGKHEAVIMGDPNAKQLVSLLASRQAKFFILKVGLLNSLGLASVAAVVILFLPKPIPSTLRGGVLIEFAFLFCMASMALQGNLLLRWVFRKWKGNAR